MAITLHTHLQLPDVNAGDRGRLQPTCVCREVVAEEAGLLSSLALGGALAHIRVICITASNREHKHVFITQACECFAALRSVARLPTSV
eukprot:109787-Pelagomonas_calceolata.AAC.7